MTPIAKLSAAEIVKRAVKGMLPKNKLRQLRLDRLKVSLGKTNCKGLTKARFLGV